nr:NAD(P)H-dependent oxidoreductase [Enterovirga sp. DB1703]
MVFAHPEPKSFNAALRDRAVDVLRECGHAVVVSDLYEMKFKAVIDHDDFPDPLNPAMLQIPLEQEAAHARGTTAADIAAEQRKLIAADLVIFQFPLWLYGLPAILKGWCERVFSSGFAHETTPSGERRWFENGGLKGRRAMLSLTCAGAETAFQPDGRHGDMDRILWPIHNALRYAGFDVLPPVVSYAVLRGGELGRANALDRLEGRLRGIETDTPIPFHSLDEYDDAHRLKAGIAPRTPGQHRGPGYLSRTPSS